MDYLPLKRFMKNKSFLLIVFFLQFACNTFKKNVDTITYPAFELTQTPPATDYSLEKNWAALPNRYDYCDNYPNGTYSSWNDTAIADVFFIHPTSYTRKRINNQWNACVDWKSINDATDKGSIKFQASVFNRAGRIYAPRYRQAHISTYFTNDEQSGYHALDIAYEDVRAAFEFYLKHYNHGRPIIIASHSQGTTHATRLLKEFFDGKKLQQQLVVAYLVGMAVSTKKFSNIPASTSPDQINCVCAWRSFEYGYTPKNYPLGDSIICTNPLSWNSDSVLVNSTNNKGAVLRNFKPIYTGLADAKVHNGIVWVHKPVFPGSKLIHFKNYHIADYNFFYFNIQENVHERLMHYLKVRPF